MKNLAVVALISLAALSFVGCTNFTRPEGALGGAVLGAGAGAAVGGIAVPVFGAAPGAVVGAAGGAILGAVAGKEKDKPALPPDGPLGWSGEQQGSYDEHGNYHGTYKGGYSR